MGEALMIILALVVIAAVMSIAYYNTFVRLRNQIGRASCRERV